MTSIAKSRPAVKKKAGTKSTKQESRKATNSILSQIKNVVDDTAAKIKALLPTVTTTDKESISQKPNKKTSNRIAPTKFYRWSKT